MEYRTFATNLVRYPSGIQPLTGVISMNVRKLAIVAPLAAISIVPALALSSESETLAGDGATYLASYQDPNFSSDVPQADEDVNAPQPDWPGAAAGAVGRAMAYGGTGRAGAMIARGARGLAYLNGAGIGRASDDYTARNTETKHSKDTDFDY